MKKTNNLLYFFSSVILIVIAIIFVAIINRVQSTKDNSTDVRARASATGVLQLSGVLSAVNESEGVLIVDNLTFKESANSLGTWTVTPPPGFSFATAVPGSIIRITLEPRSMLAETKTLSATEISFKGN